MLECAVFIGPVYIPDTDDRYVAPRCPHCNHELSGWSEPSDAEFHWYYVPIVIAGLGLVVGAFFFTLSTIADWLDGSRTLWQAFADNCRWLFSHKLW